MIPGCELAGAVRIISFANVLCSVTIIKHAPYIRRINYYNFRVNISSLCARLKTINSEVRDSHESTRLGFVHEKEVFVMSITSMVRIYIAVCNILLNQLNTTFADSVVLALPTVESVDPLSHPVHLEGIASSLATNLVVQGQQP